MRISLKKVANLRKNSVEGFWGKDPLEIWMSLSNYSYKVDPEKTVINGDKTENRTWYRTDGRKYQTQPKIAPISAAIHRIKNQVISPPKPLRAGPGREWLDLLFWIRSQF